MFVFSCTQNSLLSIKTTFFSYALVIFNELGSNTIKDSNFSSRCYEVVFRFSRFYSTEEMSVGRKEAFEVFRRDYVHNDTIEENKKTLKQRFVFYSLCFLSFSVLYASPSTIFT